MTDRFRRLSNSSAATDEARGESLGSRHKLPHRGNSGVRKRASLAFAVLLGQRTMRSDGDWLRANTVLKRIHDVAWPILGLSAVAVSSWLLFKDLRGLSLASLKNALSSISPARWLFAIGSTSLAYAALAWYDQIALLHLRRRISWRYVAVASFTAYALAHNIGASVLSGAVVRYRAYSAKGLGVAEIGVLVAFCSFTFGLGATTVAGFSLLFHPELILRFPGAPLWLGRAGGIALIAAPSLYAAGSLLHFPPLKIGAYELIYPRPPIAARQLLAGPLELVGASGIIYLALPAAANPGFAVVLGVFVASFSIALISHAPGGLGVLELSFVEAMPDEPKANVVAALLVFRLLYLILPLMFALVVVMNYERKRLRAPAAVEGGNVDGLVDLDR
jgi:glycosyltransferase 2 family protein